MKNSDPTDDPLPNGVLALFDEAGTSSLFYMVFIIGLLSLLLLSALFSGTESIFLSLSNQEKTATRQSPHHIDRHISRFSERPKWWLATLVLANHLINLSIPVLGTYGVWRLTGFRPLNGILWTGLILVLGFWIVFFGEVLPKIYARKNRFRFMRLSARLLILASYGMAPFTWVLLQITTFIERRLHKRGYRISSDELTQVLESNASTTATENERQLLKGVVNFGNTTARQIMRPRPDVMAMPTDLNFHELMDKINKSGYSRIPVYDETVDSLTGILYSKDLLPYLEESESFDWRLYLRPAYYITENKKIDDLLHDFQVRRVHMAIVVDEYGGTSGLVTLEDIMEEITGELRDEFDEDEKPFTQIDDRTYVFEGKILLNDFCRVMALEPDAFDEVRGDNESLGGLLLELFTRLPLSGEKIHFQQWTFTVLSADTKRIKRVKVAFA